MSVKLDLKDKKILWELDKDSRQPLSKIAKNVRLSKEAVYYRIKNLEKRKIIAEEWSMDVARPKTIHLEYLELEAPFRQQLLDGKMIQLKITLGYRAKDKKLNQIYYLNENNSFEFFKSLGDILITGPTGTNVMDLQILIKFKR